MAVSNRERVGRAFEVLATGLAPFVDRPRVAPRQQLSVEVDKAPQPNARVVQDKQVVGLLERHAYVDERCFQGLLDDEMGKKAHHASGGFGIPGDGAHRMEVVLDVCQPPAGLVEAVVRQLGHRRPVLPEAANSASSRSRRDGARTRGGR